MSGLGKASRKDLDWPGGKGFDFLGYRFSPNALSVAQVTWEKFLEHAFRLYEQEARGAIGGFDRSSRFGEYVRRWLRWSQASLLANPSVRPVAEVIAP
jgi:hypothetical protein